MAAHLLALGYHAVIRVERENTLIAQKGCGPICAR
jgi:hypothetical protein